MASLHRQRTCLVKPDQVIQGDILVGATWSQIQGLQVFPWFDRVHTKSNPVDGLSRRELAGPWTVESSAFPDSLLRGPREEPGRGKAFTPTRCWQLPDREDGSTSER